MFPSPGQGSSVSRQEWETIGWESSPRSQDGPTFCQAMQFVRKGEESSRQRRPLDEFPETVQLD